MKHDPSHAWRWQVVCIFLAFLFVLPAPAVVKAEARTGERLPELLSAVERDVEKMEHKIRSFDREQEAILHERTLKGKAFTEIPPLPAKPAFPNRPPLARGDCRVLSALR